MTSRPGRNDACHCGSGKKYKKCCLATDEAAPGRARPRPPALGFHQAEQPAWPHREPFEPSASAAPAAAPAATPVAAPAATTAAAPAMSEPEAPEALAAQVAGLEGELPAELGGQALFDRVDPALLALQRAGRHAEALALLDRVEQRCGRGFAELRESFELERFKSASRLGDPEQEARRLGPHVYRRADVVAELPSRLAWEGHTRAALALADGARLACAGGEDAPRWVRDEWHRQTVELRVVDHLDRDPTLALDDGGLQASLQPLVDEGHALDDIRTHAMVWLALLRPGGDEAIVQAELLKLGKGEDPLALRQVTRLGAKAAARLRERAGWSRGQTWALLRELTPLLNDCAEASRRKKAKIDAAALLLPQPALLHSVLGVRNRNLFHQQMHRIAAVTLALPAWAGVVAEGGWATDRQALDWQQQVMAEAPRDWSAAPAEHGELARRVLAFAEREGRQREAWLR